MQEAAPLVLNLRNTSYCKTVYGGVEPHQIAARFSAVEPSTPTQLLKRWDQDKLLVRLPRKIENLKNLPHRLASFIQVVFNKLKHTG